MFSASKSSSRRAPVSDPVSNIMEEMRASPAATSPILSQASQAQQDRSAAAKRMEERAAEQERRRREAVSIFTIHDYLIETIETTI